MIQHCIFMDQKVSLNDDQRLVIQGKLVRLVLVKTKRHIEVVFRVTKNVLKRQEFLTAFHTCVLADLPMTMILCSDFLLAVKINFLENQYRAFVNIGGMGLQQPSVTCQSIKREASNVLGCLLAI